MSWTQLATLAGHDGRSAQKNMEPKPIIYSLIIQCVRGVGVFRTAKHSGRTHDRFARVSLNAERFLLPFLPVDTSLHAVGDLNT